MHKTVFPYKILFSFIIFLCCQVTEHSHAQQQTVKPEQYRVVNWNAKHGLESDITNVMIKDANGFLWIGNNFGDLSRFNGKEFIAKPLERRKWASLHTYGINAFKEDSLHNIWIGTDNGLYRYDIQMDTISFLNNQTDSSVAKAKVIPFWTTNDEVYCFESNTWIISYNVHSLEYKRRVKIPESYQDSLHLGQYTILDRASNSIWIIPYNWPGLFQLSLSTGAFILHHRTDSSSMQVRQSQKAAEAMCFDANRNCIWINSHDGLTKFDISKRQFSQVEALNEYSSLKNYGRWVGIDLDLYGRIWLTTQPKGILIYDPETNQCKQLIADTALVKRTGDANLQIYCDREGIIWASYWMDYGINQFLPYLPPVKRYSPNHKSRDSLSHGSIYKMVAGPNGKIWVGTMDGLNVFDPISEKFTVLRQKDLPGLKGEAIVPLHIDTINQLAWLYAGPKDPFKMYEMKVYELNMKTMQCKPITFMDGSKLIPHISFEINAVQPFDNGIMLGADNYGVFRIEPGNQYAKLQVPTGFGFGFSSFAISDKRFMFLRSWNKLPNFSFELKNEQWVKMPHLMDSIEWNVLYFNEKDTSYWVSLRHKLVHYDKDFREIKTYTKENGYTSPIQKMLFDDQGNLWFVNPIDQAGRLNIRAGNITTLSENDGFYEKDFDWSVPFMKDGTGIIYLGTGYGKDFNVGLDRIIPDRYHSDIISRPYLDSISINNQLFTLAKALNNLDEIRLDYDQNRLKIITSIIDFYSNGKSKLRYKLEAIGEETKWEYASDDTLRFDGLLPGSYRLVLQTSNAGNEFNSPEKILFISIDPPFWSTWWFRILAALVFVLLVYGFIQYRSRNLKQRNAELEQKVLHRTIELKHSLEELRETQDQLIHREKMASLGELTAGIAHEIQNPLNFVNNFSDVNTELITELKAEADKGNLSEVKAIADDISDNEQKINHHGKRADAIVKGMLQHSRAGTGLKEPTDINAMTEEYLRLSYHGLKAKEKNFNATLETEFDENIGKLNIIPQDIGRVLLNVYNNAFFAVMEKKKEAPDDYEPLIKVSTKKRDSKIEIRVQDNGKGIPENIKSKIFQPFFTTKPTGQGTGLGLSLSYDIVKAHGGSIEVESTFGEGSTFIIQF